MLEDKIVIVSGIGPGMGRDISLACARDGADIVLAARTEATLEAVAAEVRELGRRTLCVPTNVTDVDQCRNLVERTLEEFGRVDVLVNNAATGGHEVELAEATERQIQHAIRINLGGTMNMTQAVIPAMREGGGGSIVITGTLAMRRIQRGRGTYAASKAALMTAAQTLALELGQDNIRVNTVVPSYIMGGALRYWFNQLAEEQGVDYQTIHDERAAESALNRIATSAEIAEAVVFFASDRSRAITGQSLDVNCGSFFV